jgi:hypothetical protein
MKFAILIFLICISACCAGQMNLQLEGNFYHGFVLPEYSNFTYLVEKPIQSASLSLASQTTGKNDWEKIYNYPSYGLTLLYSTLGNHEVHGSEIAIFPYFNLNIVTRRRFNLFNQTGLGVGYVTRKFNTRDNFSNVVVGSHINIHFNLKFGVNYELTNRVRFQTGLSFDHFSNSNTREPNIGINYVAGFAGVGYAIGEPREKLQGEIQPHRRDVHFEFIYSAGGKHASALDTRIYFTTSGTFEVKWHAYRVLHLGLGADLFYDTSTETEMKSINEAGFRKGFNFRSGLHLSQEFVYDRLSLILQEGIYMGLTDKVNHYKMYNRGIVRYRVSTQAFVQVAMKSHLHILDYPELGVGIKW